jgi:hypothetical protein
MTKDELASEVETLKHYARAEHLLKIAAPTHTHGNTFVGSGELLKQKQAELDAMNEQEEAQAFYAAYLQHHRTQGYADAGQIDRGALDDLEREYPALQKLRQRRVQ